MRIEGEAALVTGGASGLGEATVRRLTKAGAAVTIVDRDEARAQALAAELGGQVRAIAADVADPEQVKAAVDLASSGPPLRVAINCAGIGWAQRTIGRDGSPHDFGAFELVLRVNLLGTFNVLRLAASAIAAAEPLDDGERGVIVNTASIAAFDGQIGQASYSASKGGIVGMTLPVARDLGAVGVRLNCIAPGLIDTPIYGTGAAAEEFKDRLKRDVLFPKRLGTPDELGAMVVSLLTNSYMNGEVVRVDGGTRMQPK